MPLELARWLFDPSGLTPHGFCLLWEPGLIWTHATADIVIGLAYFTIPVALAIIARRRRDLIYAPVVWLFFAFILLCGAGHWLALLTLWVPAYGVEAVVKAMTAVVSIVTALVLGHLLPKLLASHEALLSEFTLSKLNEAISHAARQQADAAARAKSEFLATMSHEIRSPMSGLVGVLDLLRETRLDPDQVGMANMVHGSAMSLLAVLNDILDFSKIESGAFSIVLEPTQVCEVVSHLAQPHLLGAARKNVNMTLQCSSDLPPYALIDALRLRQIINNLLSNAVKFTANGEIKLNVDVARNDPEPRLRFTVSDTGIGMTPDVLAQLFTPFMQANGSTTRDFGGTGLGLCISRRLAELLDGSLTVTSQPGVGSVFTLLLPLVTAPAPPLPGNKAERIEAWSLAGSARVLVADDDPTNRWLTRRQLELLGLTVDVAENGVVALEMLQANHYDMLLTDCHMPRMDGVELTHAVRNAAVSSLRRTPIIGLTADVTEAQRERCTAAGMTDVAIKPLGRDKLSALLSRHLPVALIGIPPARPSAPEPIQSPSFDDAMYRDMFAPGDHDGEVWLSEFQQAAKRLENRLRELLVIESDGLIERAQITATAHRLAGSALSAGATRLGNAARALEHTATTDDRAALQISHAIIHDELNRAMQAISTFVANFKSELTT